MNKRKKDVVLITGAAGGIGTAICKAFTDKGYFVIGTDKKMGQDSYISSFIQMDLQSLVQTENTRNDFLQKIRSVSGDSKVSIIINNAAIQLVDRIADIKLQDFHKTMDINVIAPMLTTKLLLEDLKATKGSIINIGSVHAALTKPGFIAYATSKSALVGLTRSLAVELGEWGIKVNCIQPGAFETEMLMAGFADKPDKLDKLTDCIPLNHIGKPEDIAALALFLAEQKNGYISGATIQIDGGISSRLHDPA